MNESQAEVNVTVIDRVADEMAGCTNTINTNTKKHLSEINSDSSTHRSKRSKKMDSNENFQTNNRSENEELSKKEADTLRSIGNISDSSKNIIVYPSNMSQDGETGNNGISHCVQNSSNHFSPPYHVVAQGDHAIPSSLPKDNLNSIEECTNVNKAVEKDSGRSTMLKSSTFEESNARITKPLTGRISKNYKKKDNFGDKISKVLARSVNTSREYEILNEKEPDTFDSLDVNNADVRSIRTSLFQSQLTAGEYINLWSNENLVSLSKYGSGKKTHTL